MPKYLTKEEAFLKCKKEGRFLFIEDIDTEKIKSTLRIAEGDVEAAEVIKKSAAKNNYLWNSAYKLYYDALHELTESYLRFEKIKIENHQCLFVFLCEKHPELEFEWDFFEKVRTKRNGINYYGLPVDNKDWKEVELQFKIYINALKKEIEKKINQRV